VTIDIVELFLARGDVQLARMALEKVDSRVLVLPRVRARFHGARALLLNVEGDLRRALSDIVIAIDASDACKDREYSASTQVRYAALLEESGDREGALGALVAAMETVRAIHSDMPESLRKSYLSAPNRKILREEFQRLSREAKAPSSASAGSK
jgi:hypothetical protein